MKGLLPRFDSVTLEVEPSPRTKKPKLCRPCLGVSEPHA